MKNNNTRGSLIIGWIIFSFDEKYAIQIGVRTNKINWEAKQTGVFLLFTSGNMNQTNKHQPIQRVRI